MAVNVKIISKGLFKKKIDIQEIIKLQNLAYGICNENYVIELNRVGNHTLLFEQENLARGIDVWFDKNSVCLSLSLPTTYDEIRLFYCLIESICNRLNVKKFYRDDELVNIIDKESFIQLDKKASIDALNDIKDKILENQYERFEIIGVMNPISLGKKEIEEIDGNIENFKKFLNRLQQMDVYFSSPRVYRKKDGIIFGVYFIGEDITSVVPNKPYIFMNQIKDIKEWYVFISKDNYIKYEDFINNVNKIDDYDTNHIIVRLSKDEIKELLEKYKVEI